MSRFIAVTDETVKHHSLTSAVLIPNAHSDHKHQTFTSLLTRVSSLHLDERAHRCAEISRICMQTGFMFEESSHPAGGFLSRP